MSNHLDPENINLAQNGEIRSANELPSVMIESTITELKKSYNGGISFIRQLVKNIYSPTDLYSDAQLLAIWKQGVLNRLSELELSDTQKNELEKAFVDDISLDKSHEEDFVYVGELLDSERFFPYPNELIPNAMIDSTIILLAKNFKLGIELIERSLEKVSGDVLKRWKKGVLDKLSELNLSDIQKSEVEQVFAKGL
jgi:hypothetical protein